MKTQKPEQGNPDGNFKILFDKNPKIATQSPKTQLLLFDFITK